MFKNLFVITLISMLSGCASMPLPSMYKLYRLSPMEADPAQIKIAIRAHQAIGIPHGAARMEVKYENHDKSKIIEDIYFIEITQNAAVPAELKDDKAADEAITILQLTEQDAESMRKIQAQVKADKKAGIKGMGSFGLGLHGTCLQGTLPEGSLYVDIFMQTSDEDSYFIFTENLDIRESQKGWEGDLSKWPECE